MSTSPTPASPPREAIAPATSYRWIICALLLFSTTINYMDRNVISFLKGFFCTPAADGGFGWSNTDYAFVLAFFTAFYAGMTKFGLSAFGAITIFGVVVAGTMWLIRRWHQRNCVHHRAEVEHLLAIARSDGH